jgi:hypothetical protein
MRSSLSCDLLRLVFAGFLATLSCAINPIAAAERDRDGFESLFNGRDLTGWRNSGNWKIENGTIATIKGKWDDPSKGLEYTAEKLPYDFELYFEWKADEVNPLFRDATLFVGHFLFPVPVPFSRNSLDSIGTQYRYTTGKNSIVLATERVFTNFDSERDRYASTEQAFGARGGPAHEWNQGRITYQGPIIKHWINGQTAFEVDLDGAKDGKRQAEVDFELKRYNVAAIDRPIFQRQFDHWSDLRRRGLTLRLRNDGDLMWYRNIKLRSLVKEK